MAENEQIIANRLDPPNVPALSLTAALSPGSRTMDRFSCIIIGSDLQANTFNLFKSLIGQYLTKIYQSEYQTH